MPEYQIIDLPPLETDRLQRFADRLAQLKARENEVSVQLERLKLDTFGYFDAIFWADAYLGPNAHLIFESSAPNLGWRMLREVSYSRSFDLEGLHAALTPKLYKAITKLSADTAMIDAMLKRGELPADIVERYTTYRPVAKGPIWRRSGGETLLEPGQLAYVLPDPAKA